MTATPPHTVHAAPRTQGLGTLLLLLVVVVIGAGAAVLWSMNANRPQALSAAAGTQGDIAALRDRLSGDEARLAALEHGSDASGSKTSIAQAQSDLAALSARVSKLETTPEATARLDEFDRRLATMRADSDTRLSALERNMLGSDLPQRLAALETRVGKLENAAPAQTMRRAAAELALANLVRASGAATPFAAELQTFRVLMPDAREAGELAGIAASGAPTEAMLAQRFPDMAANALAAERRSRATSWLGRLWANIGNVIVIRRVGDVQGADSEAILARAGARLDAGDLAGAVRETRTLKGVARSSAAAWLKDAQARLLIRRDTAALAQRFSALLAAP